MALLLGAVQSFENVLKGMAVKTKTFALLISHKIDWIFVLAFFVSSLSVAVAQNVPDAARPNDIANDKNAKTIGACRALVGRTFWYKPGTSEALFIKPTATGDLPSRIDWKKLLVGKETSV